MSLTQSFVPACAQMLRALSAWLDKACDDRSPADAQALLGERLAPDMFPLATQIRFACLQVHEASYRLRGLPRPAALDELTDEGRNAGEHPGTIDDAQQRIQEALAVLDALPDEAFDESAGEEVAIALPMGLTFDVTGAQYVRDWALPQLYFHVMAAYAILRSRGIELGKADYVAHMFAYQRPETALQA